MPTEPPELDPGEHLLLTPRGDAEALLGRTVERGPDGGYVVSDARPPGCEVQVRRVPERWHRRYQQDAGRAAYVGTGDTAIGSLQAHHGKSLRIEAEVENHEVIHADLRGCRGEVVSAVKVGTGRREIKAQDETRVEARARVKGVPVGGGAGKWRAVERAHAWDEPQAWAFSVTTVESSGDIRLDVVMPARLGDGEEFDVKVLTSRQVWLIVGFLHDDGSGGILMPRLEHPRPVITAGVGLDLRLAARTRPSGQPTRERLVVYAFGEEGDFDMFKPPMGALDDDTVTRYFADLPERLEAIPSRRWTKAEVHVLVEPNAPAAVDADVAGEEPLVHSDAR